MSDSYTPYETGLRRLLDRLGRDHPRYGEVLTYKQRLEENIARSRRYGDTETRRAERAEILEQLNAIPLDLWGVSLTELGTIAPAGRGSDAAGEGIISLPEEGGGEGYTLLADALGQGKLLVLWGALPFPLLERAPKDGERVAFLNRLTGEAAALEPPALLPQLPPLPMLSLDPGDRVERAFQSAGIPLPVVPMEQPVPPRRGACLLKLAGDLDNRSDVVLSRAQVGRLRSDKGKRALLEEARRRCQGGALLILGADPANEDFVAWWAVLAPTFQGIPCLALGDPGLPWPEGVVALGEDEEGLLEALHSAASPEEDEPPPFQPPRPRVPFKLQLLKRQELAFEVLALETPKGEPSVSTSLPYRAVELPALLKALLLRQYDEERFSPEQRALLEGWGFLLEGGHLAPDMATVVGEALYQSLLAGKVHTAFQVALTQVRPERGTVQLQLRFQEDAVELARYPWELLYHRRALLPSRAVALTRYISYDEAVTPLAVSPPLELLYIQSRPSGLKRLPRCEQASVHQALAGLEEEHQLHLAPLPQATYNGLLDYLEAHPVHALHFDGHGVFARLCPQCGAMNYPHHLRCQAPRGGSRCDQDLQAIAPRGYLAFEGPGGAPHWVSSETLGTLLYPYPLRLVVLSACWSGNVAGESLFGGLAPALIQAGVPAVVATQLPMSAGAALTFMQGFYRALARFESLPAAVNAGRRRIFETKEWFIPTLYLRSTDDQGYLFQQEGG